MIEGGEVVDIGRGGKGEYEWAGGVGGLRAFDGGTIRLVGPDEGGDPARCNGGNVTSVLWRLMDGGGAWGVRPALAPPSKNKGGNTENDESITDRTDEAFERGGVVSEGRGIEGVDGLPDPPVDEGIVIGRIVDVPWGVVAGLCPEGGRVTGPGNPDSILIVVGDPQPDEPPIEPNNICNNPIKIWLVEINEKNNEIK